MSNWTIFSNHGHVLVCLARDPDARLRDIATNVGITERAVQKIVRDLQQGGMVSISKQGRRNRYRINRNKSLRHELEAHRNLGDLVNLIGTDLQTPEITDQVVAVETSDQVDSGVTGDDSFLAFTVETIRSQTPEPQTPDPERIEQATAEKGSAEPEPAKSEPAKSEPPIPEPAKPEPVIADPAKPKSKKSEQQSPAEKQQGSLF